MFRFIALELNLTAKIKMPIIFSDFCFSASVEFKKIYDQGSNLLFEQF